MSTKINVTYKNKEYTLEYNRNAAQAIESQGFVLDQVEDKPSVMIPLLVHGAFMKHNRGIKRALIDEIYENIVGKIGKDGEEGFIAVLCDMYAETVNTLMDDKNGDEGNAATWTVTRG
jgi:hypothetical protein